MKTKDTQHLIGNLLKEGEGVRDAIHIAVLPVICGEDKYLRPGDHLKFAYGSQSVVLRANPEYGDHGIGIVDPFLNLTRYDELKKGSRFFMYMLPNTVTGMTHQWHHPQVDNPPQPANKHEKWLREFAQKWNFDYDEMIASAIAAAPSKDKDGYEHDNYVVACGIDLHSRQELGEDHDLFWQHLEALTGNEFNNEHREKFGWSCAC